MLSERRAATLEHHVAAAIRARNPVIRTFFAAQSPRIALAAQEMAARFLRGGRLYACGRGSYATDAAHVSVEFVHPVIVGKRALPAFDVSAAPRAFLETLCGPHDMVLAFGPPEGDEELLAILDGVHARGTLTVALPGTRAGYAFAAPTSHEHMHQELFEVLGHTLYESVHVFLEHRERGHDVGLSGFLYPYLGAEKQDTGALVADVARSIVEKAREGERLREQVAERQSGAIAAAARAMAERLARGGRLYTFGNGGSATDATDFALDCVQPPAGMRPVPAVSLASEPATLTAISNDVGVEVAFLRQIIARCGAPDIAFALSTSGGSKNVVAALAQARKRGMLTVALLGYDGGEIARNALADHAIVVDCDYIPRIQETQAAVYHTLREALTHCDA